MYETLRMCQSIACGNVRTMTEAEVLALPDESVKVAEFYRRNFGLIKRASDKYFNMNGSDKASLILSTIANAVKNYIGEEDGGSKFSVYVIKAIQNALKDEYRKMARERSHFGAVSSIDEMKESGYEPSIDSDSVFGEYESNLDLSVLNDQQRKVCLIIMRDNRIPTNVDIAKEIGVSPMRVIYIKRAIAEKLSTQFMTM